MDSVAIVKHEGDVAKALEQGIRLLGGFGALSSPVIIKPNICAEVVKTKCAVTDVKVVEALIRLVLREDQGLSIEIVESDSESKFADEAFETFGYKRLEEEMQESGFDVTLVNLSQSPTVLVKLDGQYFQNPELPDVLMESSYFISLAVAKTHYLTFITGALKNLFGLLPRKDQAVYHSKIDAVLVDLNRLIRPNLSIVDARVGLEGWEGPTTRRLDRFIIGRTPVSVDATLARMMGFTPETIRHLVEAQSHGLGSLNPTIVGESLASSAVKFNPPSHVSPSALLN
jgi:uncharacterized protein (DUF362 family)